MKEVLPQAPFQNFLTPLSRLRLAQSGKADKKFGKGVWGKTLFKGFSPEMKTIGQSLREAEAVLKEAGVDSPGLDAELLLAFVLGTQRTFLHKERDYILSPGEWEHLWWLIRRRSQREPLAYIIRKKEFWSLDFEINPSALIPRPETETLVETAIKAASALGGKIKLLELGTGCGAIAIALAKELKEAKLWATDHSKRALALAKKNARRHLVDERITFLKGDLFKPVAHRRRFFDIILSNPPYVPSGQIEGLAPEIRDYEPISAIDGGEDGLRFHRRITEGAPRFLKPGGFLLLEIGDGQEEAVAELVRSRGAFSNPEFKADLRGSLRVVWTRLL